MSGGPTGTFVYDLPSLCELEEVSIRTDEWRTHSSCFHLFPPSFSICVASWFVCHVASFSFFREQQVDTHTCPITVCTLKKKCSRAQRIRG